MAAISANAGAKAVVGNFDPSQVAQEMLEITNLFTHYVTVGKKLQATLHALQAQEPKAEKRVSLMAQLDNLARIQNQTLMVLCVRMQPYATAHQNVMANFTRG